MRYPIAVKHNGVEYAPGQEVPIGQEPVKETADKEKTVNEIREELRALGVTTFPSNKKADLIALLEETKASIEAGESNEDEDEEITDEEITDEESDEETDESEEDETDTDESDEESSEDESYEDESEENEDEDSDLLNTIANEE